MLDLIRFIIAIPFFLYASYSDWKDRLISPLVWFILGFFAFAIDFYQFLSLTGIIALIPSIIIFYEWFFEWENREKILQYSLWVISFAIFFYSIFTQAPPALLVMFLMLVIFRTLHKIKIIRGRADVRALMTVAILQPLYPEFFNFPIFKPELLEIVELTFPFAFLTLLYAAIASLLFILVLFLRNLIRGDIGFPEMFIGYRIPLDEVNKRHVWLMERVENGEHVLYIHPKEHTHEDLISLKKIGRDRVWVQPKIPFIIFITIGLLAAYLLGNFI
ncbi:MAG: peptidase A24 [Thermoproteota archaeon]|nr:MAG: peptidase A24 [Candidatus Korarchaeota archaeon]